MISLFRMLPLFSCYVPSCIELGLYFTHINGKYCVTLPERISCSLHEWSRLNIFYLKEESIFAGGRINPLFR